MSKGLWRRRWVRFIAVSSGGLALAGGVAYATIPDSNGVLHGCVKSNGQVRVIDVATESCRPKKSTSVEWYSKAGADAAFLGAGGKAADADLLDGKDSTEFLGAAAKAADSDKLDGIDSTAFQARVTGTCSGSAAVQTIGATGNVTCVSPPPSHVLSPGIVQFTAAEQERVVFDRGGFQVVAVCTATTGELRARVTTENINIVTDSRKISRGQTLFPGDLTIGTADAASALDRGEFNILSLTNGRTLNGSFYILWSAQGCQVDASAITSDPATSSSSALLQRRAGTGSALAIGR